MKIRKGLTFGETLDMSCCPVILKFAGKVEFDILKLVLSHLQDEA